MSPSDLVAEALGTLPDSGPPAQVVDQVTEAFEELGTPHDAEGVARFMPGIDRTYGLRVMHLRQIGALVVRRYSKDPHLCQSVALASWARRSREHRLFALFVLERLDLPHGDLWALGERFLPDCLTWEDVDQLCGATLGRALCMHPPHMDVLEEWLDSEHHWTRRAALVTTVYLRRAKLPVPLAEALDRRTLAMCARRLNDRDAYVRKAVDWAVREVLNRRYELTRAWLIEQAEAGPSRAARTVLKLSAKKLEPDDQAEFLSLLDA